MNFSNFRLKDIIFYGLCGISLIPILGIPALLFLILNILKDKEELRTTYFFAFASLCIQLSVYIFFMNQPKLKEGYQQDSANISKMYMGEIVKDLEYYKQINGSYPKSIIELSNRNKLLNIRDFSYLVDSNKNGTLKCVIYYYEPINKNAYFLSGIGPDGLPKTADDLLPDLTVAELQKTGLKVLRK